MACSSVAALLNVGVTTEIRSDREEGSVSATDGLLREAFNGWMVNCVGATCQARFSCQASLNKGEQENVAPPAGLEPATF